MPDGRVEALSEDPRSPGPSPQPPPARGGGEPAHSDLPLPLREGVGGRGQRALCRFDDLPDGTAKGFPPAPGGFTGLFAVRQGDAIFVYVNACPHIGTPLEWTADRFLSHDGSLIICATHGAEFRIADGECLRGPCFGERLEPVMIQIKDGTIFVPEDAGL
jgi:nitrite reductase/ring-hydroxylating ferredoxin subunit